MNNTISRRRFMNILGASMASFSFGMAIHPLEGTDPSLSLMQDLSRINADEGLFPAPMLPGISPAEVEFLASHELIYGDTNRKVVIMSYDDVLDNERLSHLLDVYLEHGVKCSFFIIGIDLENCKETLPRLVAEGHDLGCHGWIHDSPFTSLTDQNIHDQLGKFVATVNVLLPGHRVRYFRAPYGDRNQRVRDLAAAWGMQHILWSLESGGLDKTTVHYVVDRVQNGSIVLSHAHRPFDVSEADVIVKELLRKDYNLETITTGMDPKDRWQES